MARAITLVLCMQMIAIIIAGGSGTRLWPLSTGEYPKHLLKLTNHKSLLQNTYERASLVADQIYLISDSSHVDHVYDQLPDLPKDHVIVEPGRRGTASCVIAALAYIKKTSNKDEPIVFMHADHHILDNEGFIDTVKRAADMTVQHKKIVLLGLEPTHPATGFGYIERGKNMNGGLPIYDVESFKEKPDLITAKKYIANGNYLWNMGYFVASLDIFEHSIKSFAPDLWHNYNQLLNAKDQKDHAEKYLAFENQAIDIALIEQVKELLVTPGTFDWMDVGSYKDVHQVNAQDEAGNTLEGNVQVDEVTNSLIRNHTDVPVAVIGLDDVAVISTPHGILVVNKSHAQKVGDVSKRFSRPLPE